MRGSIPLCRGPLKISRYAYMGGQQGAVERPGHPPPSLMQLHPLPLPPPQTTLFAPPPGAHLCVEYGGQHVEPGLRGRGPAPCPHCIGCQAGQQGGEVGQSRVEVRGCQEQRQQRIKRLLEGTGSRKMAAEAAEEGLVCGVRALKNGSWLY